MAEQFTIHYACASLVPERTSYVTAIGVCDTATKEMITFSMEDVQKNLGTQSTPQELEASLLKEFFSFVSDHPDAFWIHWHMHSLEYGFGVLQERYEMLWNEQASEFTSTMNMPDKIFETMQNHCRSYPKMYQLFEVNRVNDPAILSGEEEAAYFEKAEYAPIKYSALTKARTLAKIYDALQDKTLVTLCGRSDKKSMGSRAFDLFAAAAYLALKGVQGVEIGIAFIIKKIIAWFLMPMPLGMMILVAALWFLHQGDHRRAKQFLLGTVVWFALVTHAYVSSLLLLPLESRHEKIGKIPAEVKYILLLGGDKERRAWEAIRLYRKIKGARIVTSGYSMHDKRSGAYKTSKLLIEAGVRPEDIVMQEDVKDTKEEAERMRTRVGESPFLLVTSAYHMPRSMILFQQEGLSAIAAPGDFNDRGEESIWSLFQAKHLQKTERAVHEYIGLLWVYLRGKG